MKFALEAGERLEAQSGLSASCAGCGGPVIAKCGPVRIWHWAHRRRKDCDSWWEGETEWHRNWKNQFPVEWQEVVHTAESGERHIADVKTAAGCTLEFQNSPISPAERQSRSAFYPRLHWIVNGTRRKRDVVQFRNALRDGISLGSQPRVNGVFLEDCRLFKEWADEPAPVFLDLGEPERLWLLISNKRLRSVYVAPFPRGKFITGHTSTAADDAQALTHFISTVSKVVTDRERSAHMPPPGFVIPLPRFYYYRRRRL